ncbi:WD repeat-containing protein [Cryptosporidium canis]|uniref:WD repeat-containing protein n=1 Tax=Cryptosporidium canis TaxID=195482 RepID=A0A9D5HXG6_9CRYT|nr:WD repeat-containing protein [Cryptosporidium canis]
MEGNMSDCVKRDGAAAIRSYIKSLVREDSPCVILQSVQAGDDLELTDGRILPSHNPKLIARLTTEGRVHVLVNISRGGIENPDAIQRDMELERIDIPDLEEAWDCSGTAVSNAIWCKSVIRKDDLREFEVSPVLVLLEQSREDASKDGSCVHCTRHSGVRFLTIIQFSRICDLEGGGHEILELSVQTSSESQVKFNRSVSINFIASDTTKPQSTGQVNTKIRYCRIPVEEIFKTFFNKKVDLPDGYKGCRGCLSPKNVQILSDSSMETGFVLLMANMVLLSLDFTEGPALVLSRRFLIQNPANPQLGFSGFAAQDGWLAAVSLDTLQLFIWNHYQGIAFRKFKLRKDQFGLSDSSDEDIGLPVTLSFGKDLSTLFLVFCPSIQVGIAPRQIGVFVINLNVIFSQVLCSYCVLKSLIDEKTCSEARISDPGVELRNRLQISSGSIPHVQLNDEYSPLTAYPEAFRVGKELGALEMIISSLPEESMAYLDFFSSSKGSALRQDLAKQECGWPLLFNRSWFFGDLSCNYRMSQIIVSTIKNVIASNDSGHFFENFQELSNCIYLEAILGHLQKALEGVPEAAFPQAQPSMQGSPYHPELLPDGDSRPPAEEKLQLRKSGFVQGLFVPIPPQNPTLSGDDPQEIWFTDIITSSNTTLIQLSLKCESKRHLSLCVYEEDGCFLVQKLGLDRDYSIMVMNFSRVVDWHYLALKDAESGKSFIGVFSTTMSLLGIIYSTLRYQDIDNLHSICTYNKVDPCIIPLIQLEMGFKHEELNLVRLSLENTPMVLNIEVVKLAHSMLQDANLHLSLDFTRESSKLLLQFCLEKIKLHSGPLQTQEEPNMDEFLQEISYYLSAFRGHLKATAEQNSTAEEPERQVEICDDNSESLSRSDTFVRDQVILGHYSSLVGWYLRSSHERDPQTFRERILHEIYRLICTLSTNSLTLSIHMIRQIGENTTRRMVSHLRHLRALDNDDVDLIQFSNELESYYPNNCYDVERNRIWTSLLTCSIPYNIWTDCNFQSEKGRASKSGGSICDGREPEWPDGHQSTTSNEGLDDFYLYGDDDQGSHINNPTFSAMTYPFGGLQSLQAGVRLNREFSSGYLESLKRLQGVNSISAKRLSGSKEVDYKAGGKEGIEISSRDSFYSNFPSEAISAWEKLTCCEIEDYDQELSGYHHQGGSKEADLEDDKNISNVGSIISNIPEQEGNDFVRLNNGRLISIRNSSCKQCLDLNEDEELEVEEELLNYEHEYGQVFGPSGALGDGYSLSSQDPIPDSLEKTQPSSTLLGDHNSKRGDLTWLKLRRRRREMNDHFGNTGYLSHSLSFLTEWSFDVSIRVAIEKTHLQICFVWNRLLRGVQTPPRRNEALVYSLLCLIIKKTAAQLSSSLESGVDLEIAKKVTTSIYIAVFGFMFSHFEWKSIPASVSYLDNTLFLLLKHFSVEDSFKYDLVNEIIRLNFKYSPRLTVEVFLNSLCSSGIIPIHHLKTDLLQEKINHIEVDRYKSIKYMVDKCIGFGDIGVYLFRHYLMSSAEFTTKDSLHTFLSVFEGLERSSPSSVDYSDYLNIIYIYLDRKRDIVLLSLRQTFRCLQSSVDEETYRSLQGGTDSCGQVCPPLERADSPGFMLNVLVRYFNSHYESDSELDKEPPQRDMGGFRFRGKDKRIKISPYYIISILFSLDIPRKEVYNADFHKFLSVFFPSLLKVFKESFLDSEEYPEFSGRSPKATNDSEGRPRPSVSITQIIQMTDKDSEPLVKMMELYPELRKKLSDHPNSTNEFFELFHQSINQVLEEPGKPPESPKDNLCLPIMHYVSTGRPFLAFTLLCMRHVQFHSGLECKQLRKEDLMFPDLTKEEKAEVYQSVYTLAIRNFTRDKVVCSSVIFISMLQLPTELLCTDIRVARCIYVHQILKENGSDTSKVNYETQEMDIEIDSRNSERIHEIWSLFLKFGPPIISSYLEKNGDYYDDEPQKEFQDNQKYSSSLFSVLKMLEEAAWASGDIIPAGQSSGAESGTGNCDGQALEGVDLIPHTPIWHLVATFCRIHGLPRSLTLLHELARRGEWVAFLQECDSQKCPLETVGNIINEYISDNPVLKLHLKIALNISDDGQGEVAKLHESNKESDYIIQLIDWNTLFHSLRDEGDAELGERRLREFYDWSLREVFKEIVQEMSVNRVFLYYSLFEEHYQGLAERFPAFVDGMKRLINSSINSYLLIEWLNSLCYMSIRDRCDIFRDETTRRSIFDFELIQGFEDAGESVLEMESLRSLLERFTLQVFQDNRANKAFDFSQDEESDQKNGSTHETRSGSDHGRGAAVPDCEQDGALTEDQMNLLLGEFVQGTRDIIMRMNKLGLRISSESLEILFAPSSDGPERGGQSAAIMHRDETTIVLWRLLSNIEQAGLLSRASGLFYGGDTQIAMIFKSIESLCSYDAEQAIESLERVLAVSGDDLERDRMISGFLPPRHLARWYFEQEFLRLYGRMTVEDHRTLWRSVGEVSPESRYPDEETLFFGIENHRYRIHIIDVLYFNMDKYQVSFEQFEKWLSVSEKMLLKDFYDQKRYGLLLRYLRESSSACRELLSDSEILAWLEGSFLSEIATELDIFSQNGHFKSSSMRVEFIRGYLWAELRSLSGLIQAISIDLAPLFLVKISVYCWYLIERFERWLSAHDQALLTSISIHFLMETLEVLSLCQSGDRETTSGQVPGNLDARYVKECIGYAGSRLLLLILFNISQRRLRSRRIRTILREVSRLSSVGPNSRMERTDLEFRCNEEYLDSLDEVFLASTEGSVLFTPSGYFSFKSVTTEIPFRIQIPGKIVLNDHPVDAKNVYSSVQNIVNFMFDLDLAFHTGLRFTPNIRNKLEASRQRVERRSKMLAQRLHGDPERPQSSGAKTASEGTAASSTINLSRGLQAWDSVSDYLVEVYYVSSIFIKVILIWLSQSTGSLRLNEPENGADPEKIDFNQLLVKSVRGGGSLADQGVGSGGILWRSLIQFSSEEEEPSISNVTYKMKLQSILTMLQFVNQMDVRSEPKYSFFVKGVGDIMAKMIQDSGLSENLDSLSSLDESALPKISRFVLGVLTSSAVIPLVRMVLELSILFEYGGRDSQGGSLSSCSGLSVKFKTVQKCIKVLLANNEYIDKEKVDSMFSELINDTVQGFHGKPYVTSILYQICQLIMRPVPIIDALAADIEESKGVAEDSTVEARKAIYLHLARYYLAMVGLNDGLVSMDDAYSERVIHDSISEIDNLLSQCSEKDFDPVLFTNVLVEIPEISSLDGLTSVQINKVLMNLQADAESGELKHYSSHILPNNWIRVYLSQRILSIYDGRERGGRLGGTLGLRDMVNINLISSRLHGPDLLAEFLVRKCLSRQWKTCTNFLYSKYGQYDLMIALQALVSSCELLRLTDFQQTYRVYQNLAGLFSLQLYFVCSHSKRRQELNPVRYSESGGLELPNIGVISQETKKSVYDQLTCVITKDEIDQLFGDLCQPNNHEMADSLSAQRETYYRFETEKIRLLNLDLVDLFEVVSDPQVCYNPPMVLVILSGYEAIYGPIVHSVWPRILFIHAVILKRMNFLRDYTAKFGALDEGILSSMVRIYKNSQKESHDLERMNGMTFYDFIKSEMDASGDLQDDQDCTPLETHFSQDDQDVNSVNIYDLALSWNERGLHHKLSTMKKHDILENWTQIIQNYVEDLQLRITICRMVDEDGLAKLILKNKELYNDRSLYKFALTNSI